MLSTRLDKGRKLSYRSGIFYVKSIIVVRGARILSVVDYMPMNPAKKNSSVCTFPLVVQSPTDLVLTFIILLKHRSVLSWYRNVSNTLYLCVLLYSCNGMLKKSCSEISITFCLLPLTLILTFHFLSFFHASTNTTIRHSSPLYFMLCNHVNSFCPSDAIWWHRFVSIFAQIMASWRHGIVSAWQLTA